MTETLKTIVSGRPTNADTKTMFAYNQRLYDLFLNGNPQERKEARDEILTFNEAYIWALCTKGTFRNIWVQYPLAEVNDAVATLQIALLSVLEDEFYDTWGSLIWLKACDRAKEMMHDQYNSGGISNAIVTKYRIRNEETNKSFSVVNDSALDYMGEDKDSIYGSSDPYDAIETQSTFSDFIDEALNKGFIKSGDKELMYLRDAGYSYQQIAPMLNMSETQARKRYQRAIKGCRVAASFNPVYKEYIA